MIHDKKTVRDLIDFFEDIENGIQKTKGDVDKSTILHVEDDEHTKTNTETADVERSDEKSETLNTSHQPEIIEKLGENMNENANSAKNVEVDLKKEEFLVRQREIKFKIIVALFRKNQAVINSTSQQRIDTNESNYLHEFDNEPQIKKKKQIETKKKGVFSSKDPIVKRKKMGWVDKITRFFFGCCASPTREELLSGIEQDEIVDSSPKTAFEEDLGLRDFLIDKNSPDMQKFVLLPKEKQMYILTQLEINFYCKHNGEPIKPSIINKSEPFPWNLFTYELKQQCFLMDKYRL